MMKNKFQIALGTAIRRRREALKVSQDAFADTISMHRAYYSAIERGEKNMTLRILLRVAEGLSSRVSDLFRDAGY
jgi:transcriptional regulator with XRE-family HTH domain